MSRYHNLYEGTYELCQNGRILLFGIRVIFVRMHQAWHAPNILSLPPWPMSLRERLQCVTEKLKTETRKTKRG